MTLPMVKFALTLGLAFCLLRGILCWDITFDRKAQRKGTSVNWTVTGIIQMSESGVTMYEPLLTAEKIGEVPEQRRQVTCRKNKVKKLKTSLVEMTTKLANADETIDRQRTQISHLTTQNDQLIKQLSTKYDGMAADINRADENIGKLSAKLTKQCSTKESDMAVKLKKANGRIDMLLAQLSTKYDGMAADIKNINGNIGQLKKQNEKLMTQYTKLMTQLSTKDNTGEKIASIVSMLTELTRKDIFATSCADVNSSDPRPVVTLTSGHTVVCDTTTDNGGWVVFQRRTSGDVDFYRDWQQYRDGFGSKPNNFWLGLEAIHQLTTGNKYELRVDMKYKGKSYFAQYDVFRVLGEGDKYELVAKGYHGDAGDSLGHHSGRPFTTFDRDNDNSHHNCAIKSHGGWWYHICHDSNLNGNWTRTEARNRLTWYHDLTGWTGSVSFSEMKFRPL